MPRHVLMLLCALLAAIAGRSQTIILDTTQTYSDTFWNPTGNVVIGSTATAVGELNLHSAASSSMPGSLTLGNVSGASGTVNLVSSTLTLTMLSYGAIYAGNSGSGTINLSSGATVTAAQSFFGNNAGSVGSGSIDGSTWNFSNYLEVGVGGTGSLTLSHGGTVVGAIGSSMVIGDLAGSSGQVSLSDAGSSITLNANALSGYYGLKIGNNGTGTLTIGAGSSVTNGAATDLGTSTTGVGTINVNGGSMTTALMVGDTNQGTVTVSNGGTLTINNFSSGMTVGSGRDATGTITVTGAGSTLTTLGNVDFNIGNAGNGTLNVLDGGAVSVPGGHSLFIGYGSSSYQTHTGTVTVDGPGSTLNVSADLNVGYFANGVLNVTDGGVATVGPTNYSYAGYKPGSSGTINVDGAGSKLTVGGNLTVGYDGTGALNLTNGGVVTLNNDGQLLLGSNSGSTGTLSVTGANSALTVAASIITGSNGGSSTITVGQGGAIKTLISYLNSTGGGYTEFDLNAGGSYQGGLQVGAGSKLYVDNGTLIYDLSNPQNTVFADYAHFGIVDGAVANLQFLNVAPGSYNLMQFSTNTTLCNILLSNFSTAGNDAAYSYTLNLSGSGLDLTVAAVPEPSTLALAGLGLGLIGVTTWRRRRTA